jgi:5-methylthioadenosine/S-adenosylhomocysteine deaminase
VADRILLQGGHVLTVDPQLGDIPSGDVLIEGDTIAQVGTGLSADAQAIDCTGNIVMPGFVDTHRHTWETAIRSCAPDATLDDYFVEVLDSFAPLYRPEDVYASNLAGAMECLNGGITTLVDWSHINNTPEHPDAAIQGLKEAGIRALYAYGSANTSLADYWFNSSIAIPRDDVERIHSTYFSSSDGLLTMGLATRGPGFCQDDVVRAEWGMARDLGIPITVHIAMGKLAGKWSMVKQLEGLGLLGADTTYIHCCYIDVVTTVPGDMFTEMRCAFSEERWRSNDSVWESEEPLPANALTARDMLTMATLDRAHVAGLEGRVGSLTPGKQADAVVIDGKAPGTAPVIDPVGTVVLAADVSNVDTVIVGGAIHKRDGKLTGDWDAARTKVEASSAYLREALTKKQAGAVKAGA